MVEFMTYQNVKFPVRISWYVLTMASKENDLSLEELETNLESQKDMLWYAIEAGYKFSGKDHKDFPFKRDEIGWILDANYLEFQRILAEFSRDLIQVQTNAYQKMLPTDKKK